MKRSTLGIYQFNQAVGAVVLICAALFVEIGRAHV